MKDFEDAQFVKASRLKSGKWCHTSNRQKGEGDISASYSADIIALQSKVRKPFIYKGYLCVAVGTGNHPMNYASVYKLIEPQYFEGETRTYNEMSRTSIEKRRNKKGFYHGMRVKHGSKDYVLSGEPMILAEDGEPELKQASLF